VYRRFRNKGKAVLFDIDDLVFDTRFATLVASNLGYALEEEELNQWTAFISNIGTALKASDGVITSTAYLGGLIRDFTNQNVYVSSNTFNDAQRDVSEKVQRAEPNSRGIRLGYFSGSHSHSLDFAIIKSQLAAFLRESSSSTLTIAGHLALPSDFSEFGKRITTLPFMDFLDMQKALAAIDLNLVPLQDGPFTWSKSELKYFEAALVRTPTLASATPVFRKAITQGRNGYLATGTEWLSTLRTIASRGHEELASVGAQAQHHALTAYSPESLALRLEKILSKHN
jgi:glycosyltransferase involved in cell wall biosynthesis